MLKRSLLTTLALVALVLPATASAKVLTPFGHACSAQKGLRFCPTTSDAQRVASFDGVPLDVDVTLPASGDGPFPTIVMLHGLGGSKADFESASPQGRYNNAYYAGRGYAVVNYTARGYGRSCGDPSSRTAGCERGWTHLADQRYEARDTQYLLGLLVDEGIAEAGGLGVTGVSYGGGQTQILTRLRNRVRLPGGELVRWRSPAGQGLSIAAGWARIGWSDLTYALTPNGRFLDFARAKGSQSRNPIGVEKQSYVAGLYLLNTLRAYLSPAGADPTADQSTWKLITDAGEPYGTDAAKVAKELTKYHSAVGVRGASAPVLIQNGWTDDLFPAPEALRAYNALLKAKGGDVALQLGDLGHPRGSNKANAGDYFNRQGARFFDAYLKGAEGKAPRDGNIYAFTQTCPRDAPGAGPFKARTWAKLHPGAFRFGGAASQKLTSTGGNPETGKAYDQITTGDACLTVPEERAAQTAVYQRSASSGYTMLGLPSVQARIATKGTGGELVARLWDVAGGRQRLISRGIYRLADDQRGTVTFQLFGNGWRFKAGHVAKLELVGSDPHYLRPSNDKFSVKVSKLTVELPTRDRPSASRGIDVPTLGG
jgi:predicted acyl esterase